MKQHRSIKIDADVYDRLYALRDRLAREDLPREATAVVLPHMAPNGGYTLAGMVAIGLDLIEKLISPPAPADKPSTTKGKKP